VPNSPVDVAGLVVGDRIISLDGMPVLNPGDLFAAVVTHRPGSSVDIGFTRNGEALRIQVTLAGVEVSP
jgi:S1-C subfamily serine protease